ncbi:MAG: hypothetical protein NUV67_02850 [archaeon]|nr:hypothetical protein [archaeon]
MSNKKESGFDQKNLDRLVEQATKLGLGFAIVSKEALEDVIKKTTKDSTFSEKEAKQAVTNLLNESKRRENQLRAKVKAVIKSAKANSPIVARSETIKMKAEIERLKKQLGKNKKK